MFRVFPQPRHMKGVSRLCKLQSPPDVLCAPLSLELLLPLKPGVALGPPRISNRSWAGRSSKCRPIERSNRRAQQNQVVPTGLKVLQKFPPAIFAMRIGIK